MVSANDGYLIIYDKDAKTLFVRPNDASDTYAYAVDFEEVSNLFILTDVAFLQADGKYFTIDLTDKNSTATERTLTSPERISSLASDGTYLYAHYLAGDLTIYDKNLDVAFGVDNVNSSDLVGKIVIAGEKDCLYAFPFAYGNAFFVRYDATNKTSESHSITQNITQAYVGDVVYALALIPQTNQKTSYASTSKRASCSFKRTFIPKPTLHTATDCLQSRIKALSFTLFQAIRRHFQERRLSR